MCAYQGAIIQCDGAVGELTSVVVTSTRNVDPGEVRSDLQHRLDTFGTNWTGKKSAEDLAKAGFEFTGTKDKVECKTCKIRLYNWQEDEDPLQAHKKYAPDCDFMIKNHPQIKAAPKPKKRNAPKHPHYSDYKQRLRSFDAWPLKCVAQRPDIMARSGFFYIGSADRARCYHCGVTLRDWDTDDYPPCVHKQWSENCVVVEELDIDAMRAEIRELEEEDRLKEVMKSTNFININSRPATAYDMYDVVVDGVSAPHVPSHVPSQVHAQATDVPVSTVFNVSVQAVLDMGYSMGDIEKALNIRRRKGEVDPNARSILQTIFDFEG